MNNKNINIIIAEPMSTAFNFLEDIRTRGYNPVILEAYIPHGYARKLMDEERKVKYARIKYPIKIIREDTDYDKTLHEIKELDPLLVLPGGEEGVVIGTRLADDLGLTGNPFENIAAMTEKTVMHQRLKEAGLRYIRSKEVSSSEQCITFLEALRKEDVVLKHIHGVASVGVHLVHGIKELLSAFQKESSAENMFGESNNRLMIQERIFGEEYIVNTISRDGIPALTSVLRYYKKQTSSGAIIYQGIESVNELGEKEKSLVDYAFSAVCALGITDGPVHGEYMIDSDGPVLIEANCRVMGGSAPVEFLDKVFGHHETDIILDSILDREFHREFRQRPYKPLRKGYVKDFISAGDQVISSSGIIPILLSMKSFQSGWVSNAGLTEILRETVDLETETGCVYLVHDDENVTRKEFELLMFIEENYPKLLHSDSPLFLAPDDKSQITPRIAEILQSDTEGLIFDIIEYFRKGAQGEPIVPESLLELCPYNREIMELLKRLCEI